MVALCEFVDLPEYRRSSQGSTAGGSKSPKGDYYVIGDDQHLVVRALLLFKDPAAVSRAPVAASQVVVGGQAGLGPPSVREGGREWRWMVLSLVVAVVVAWLVGSPTLRSEAR